MDKKKSVSGSSSSSLDHLFGPKGSSSSSSSTTGGLFHSIFPPQSMGNQADLASSRNGAAKDQPPNLRFPDERGERRRTKEKKSYQNEVNQPPCNLSSSIYYGGQENYSSSTPPHSATNQDVYKKDEEEGDSESASRGNWWKGSLYY